MSAVMQRPTFSACVLAAATLAAGAGESRQPAPAEGRAIVVVDNARFRAFRTTARALAGVAHEPGVAIPLEDGPNRKKGDVEFESRGSSHSARNVGGPIDVVLVVLEP